MFFFCHAEMEFDGPEFRSCIESVQGGLKLGLAIKKHSIPYKSRTPIYQRFARHVKKTIEDRRLQESEYFKQKNWHVNFVINLSPMLCPCLQASVTRIVSGGMQRESRTCENLNARQTTQPRMQDEPKSKQKNRPKETKKECTQWSSLYPVYLQ